MQPEQPDPRVQFRQGALDAIPYDLIGSRAVGVGDARRYMLADAMWPLAERLIAEARQQGIAEGKRQAVAIINAESYTDGELYRFLILGEDGSTLDA